MLRFAVELSQDVAGVHDGYIATVDYLYEWQIRNWLVTSKVWAAFASEDMTDYYFGVDEDEATAEFPAYSADAGTIVGLDLRAEYPINENWIFHSNLHVLTGSDEIDDSPISEDEQITVAVVGARYQF